MVSEATPVPTGKVASAPVLSLNQIPINQIKCSRVNQDCTRPVALWLNTPAKLFVEPACGGALNIPVNPSLTSDIQELPNASIPL